MFWFRKMIARLVFPVPLVFEPILFGSLLLLFKRTKRAGRAVIGAGILLLYFLSLLMVGDSLLRRLERQSHALDASMLPRATNYVFGMAGPSVFKLAPKHQQFADTSFPELPAMVTGPPADHLLPLQPGRCKGRDLVDHAPGLRMQHDSPCFRNVQVDQYGVVTWLYCGVGALYSCGSPRRECLV